MAYKDRDLSGYATDAEKIERFQDENRLLKSLIIEYQKEFLPQARNLPLDGGEKRHV